MNLTGPNKDLKIASKAIDKMKETTNFEEFQEEWENFLFRIERAWEFTERNLKKKKGFQQWHKPYTDLRKKDSLLIFLKQARNSEMHSISSTVSNPLKMVFKDKTGRGIALDSISSKLENGTLTIRLETKDLSPDIDVDIVPSDPHVVKFKNRGKWYNPPWVHMKERITDLHPVSLAELGLEFYKVYVSEAEYWLNEI